MLKKTVAQVREEVKRNIGMVRNTEAWVKKKKGDDNKKNNVEKCEKCERWKCEM